MFRNHPRQPVGTLCAILLILVTTSVIDPVLAEVAEDQYWSPSLSFQTGGFLIDDMALGDDGLYVSGRFTTVDGQTSYHVTRWDGATWHEVGGSVGRPGMGLTHTMYLDGTRLYVGGMFECVGCRIGATTPDGQYIDGIPANNVAVWDGSKWDNLGGGTDRAVRDIVVAPNGDVYIAGEFTRVGGISARGVARWDGTQWHDVAGGVNNHASSLQFIGNDLYVGGIFTTAGRQAMNFVARWDGAQWHTLAGGVGEICDARNDPTCQANRVSALAARGRNLFVAGHFNSVDGGNVAARNVARWDGNRWYRLGAGLRGLNESIKVLYCDERFLWAGGSFNVAGNGLAPYVARWDGSDWGPLGSGTDGVVESFERVGDVLYVGGWFDTAGGKTSPFMAEWTKRPAYFNDFAAGMSGRDIELTWDVTYTESMEGLRLFRSEADGGMVEITDMLPPDARRFVDENVETNRTYGYRLTATTPDGTEVQSSLVSVTTPPPATALEQNHPNPFNPTTTISYTLPASGHVALVVYDTAGRLVRTLVNEVRPAGIASVTWDGQRQDGSRAASGVYFYRLETTGQTLTRKMVLLK